MQTVSVFQERDAETVRVLRLAIRTVYALILVQRSGTSTAPLATSGISLSGSV
jgi:hypothetical protein